MHLYDGLMHVIKVEPLGEKVRSAIHTVTRYLMEDLKKANSKHQQYANMVQVDMNRIIEKDKEIVKRYNTNSDRLTEEERILDSIKTIHGIRDI